MALPVTRELVERAAHGLAEGGWRYTRRQLYYATCAAAETPRSRRGVGTVEMATGILLILVALIVIPIKVAFLALLALGVSLIAAGLVQRLAYRPPHGRLLAVSFMEFTERFGTLELPGLVSDGTEPPRPVSDADPIVIVCDGAESAAMVAANLAPAGLAGIVAVDVAAMPSPSPRRRVAAVHDASPRGCALPLELRDAGLEVLDLGIRPEWVDSPACQVLEGAPARLPRDLSAVLSVAEVDWLASGRRVELASLPPRGLAELLRLAGGGGQERCPGITALRLDPLTQAIVLGSGKRPDAPPE